MVDLLEAYSKYHWGDEWVGFEDAPGWDERDDFPGLLRHLELQGEELLLHLLPAMRDNLLEHLASIEPSEGAWDDKFRAGWNACVEDVQAAHNPQLFLDTPKEEK